MGDLQATWLMDGRLFFWASSGPFDAVSAEELPEVGHADATAVELAAPPASLGAPPGRWTPVGRSVNLAHTLAWLPLLVNEVHLSDSLRCWSMAARLALELAARQAVIPVVRDGAARWAIFLARPEDRSRFYDVVSALPVAARLAPVHKKGPVRLHTAEVAVQSFMDEIVDSLYRGGAWPGTTRGWMLELAEALRGSDASFRPRDARFFGVPAILASWAGGGQDSELRLGVRLVVPKGDASFRLHLFLHPADRAGEADVADLPVADAWRAGASIRHGDRSWLHPAWSALRGLARAQRIYPPLRDALRGDTPRDLVWTAAQAWAFLADGVQPLRDAGFAVELPDAFLNAAGGRKMGSRRIRARIRLELGEGERPTLGETVPYQWEVTLGDRVLSGADFREILAAREPIVQFRGQWILVDPVELARLPAGLPSAGALDTGEALRAVLTGEHNGIQVIADDRLTVLIEALRHPPDRRVPAGLHATLRPYQERGFAWLACLGDLGLGACLADDMGLGKTLQLIAHLLDRRTIDRSLPSVVVCPTSVMGNWARELARFAPSLTVAQYHGAHRDLARVRRSDVVITTYGLLARDEALGEHPWDVVVLDEAQSIKNPDAQRARQAFGLHARHRVALTGTPVENRLDELWSIFRFVVPGLLGTRAHFRKHVAVPVERFGDEDAAQRLRLGTAPFLMRRLKTDPKVVQDLPDKVERTAFCALSPEQAALYREVADEHLERIKGASKAERRGQVLAMLTALKQVCNHPAHFLRDGDHDHHRSGKLARAGEILRAILDSGERAIVFTQYREMGNLLVAWMEKHLGHRVPFLHGGVVAHERDAMVRRFQEDAGGSPILLISLRAGGVGLNLTRATAVLHYDRWWNPAVEDQATDRAYRIGQHRNVQVFKMVCQGTLEERIAAMLQDKRHLAESVVSNGEALVSELDDDALRALVALGDDAVLGED